MSGIGEFLAVYVPFLPQLIIAYVFVGHTLAPRWPAALYVFQTVVALEMVLPLGDTTTISALVLAGVVMPLVFYADELRIRLLVVSLLVTATSASELVGVALWMVATGGAESASVASSLAHYPAHVASSLLSAGVSALVLWAFRRQLPAVRPRIHGHEMRLVAFLVLQALSLDLLSRGDHVPLAV